MSFLPPTTSSEGVPLLYTRRYTPRCELAEHVLHQMSEQQLNAYAIIKEMRYPAQHTIAAVERLRSILCSPYMGLDGSFIDGYYDAKAFLDKVSKILNIEPSYYANQIEVINVSIEQK